MTTCKPLILISHPRLAALRGVLEAQGWRVAEGLELSEPDRAEVRAIAHPGEMALSEAVLAGLPHLGLIANIGTGYDGVDVAWCRAHGIEVSHAKSLNAGDVADHAIGLLIGAWRDIAAGDRFIRGGHWRADRNPFLPRSLAGCTLGIVGMGAVGQAVAARAGAFGMAVSWWGPNAKPAEWPRAGTLLDLASASDILVVCCRADAANRGLISAEIIAAVGPNGLIVNVARGSVVDEDALVTALRDKRLGGAALDVFAEEPTPASRWHDVPNVVLTPHLAGATREAVAQLVGQLVANLRAFLAGEKLPSPV